MSPTTAQRICGTPLKAMRVALDANNVRYGHMLSPFRAFGSCMTDLRESGEDCETASMEENPPSPAMGTTFFPALSSGTDNSPFRQHAGADGACGAESTTYRDPADGAMQR